MVLMTVWYFQAVTRGELRKIFSKEVNLDGDPIDYIQHEAKRGNSSVFDRRTCR
ncbi:hypothetical protein ACVILI_006522 [Mesorhizobium sp. USDA 4775]